MPSSKTLRQVASTRIPKDVPVHFARPTNNRCKPFEFGTIDAALREIRNGRMIVVVDDEDRENEGDLTMAAEMITPAAINFMAMHGRGLICLAMTENRLNELEIPPMVQQNTALHETAFTVSIDAKTRGVTTGISAQDRAQTILAAVDAGSSPDDFARPGHVFPLRPRPGGVLERRGQTEASVDLARLAGLYPAGVICEIVNDDGTMARVPDLVNFCHRHALLMIGVADLARYRREREGRRSLQHLRIANGARERAAGRQRPIGVVAIAQVPSGISP
jgi:3,4-dihydroxy 2-butanone 4-phosphate synthase/GTP cyclohydrolase II